MAAVFILYIIVFVLGLWFWKRRYKSNIPGPVGYPLIGKSLEVNENNLHFKLEEWANQYGEIFQVNMFGKNFIVLSSGKIARDALLEKPNSTIFSRRLPSATGKNFLYDHSDIVLSGLNSRWEKRRKFAHQLLHAYGEGIKEIEANIQQEVNKAVTRIKAKNGAVFDPEDIITDFLYGVVTVLIMGRGFESGSEMAELMRQYDEEILKIANLGIDFLLSWLPFLSFIPGPISTLFKNCKRLQSQFDKVMMNEVENVDKYHGMVHCLLKEQIKSRKESGKPWPSDKEVLAILTNMEGAAINTSKGVLWALFSILSTKPKIQDKLQKEVDTIIGNRQATIHDRHDLPYMEAVVMEALRFISNIPLLVPHGTSQDAVLSGYVIPEGTTVIINGWKIHHDEKVYKSPWEFIPERFLDNEGNVVGIESDERKSFMAFGIGKRACLGESFARNRIFLFMATMMQNFTLVPEVDGKPDQFDPRKDMAPGLVAWPKRYKCRAIQRYPSAENV